MISDSDLRQNYVLAEKLKGRSIDRCAGVVRCAGRVRGFAEHLINLERALTEADVAWTIAVEAEGLPMTLDFAALGVGWPSSPDASNPPPDS
ncbi:hypothetical protein [Actinoplanes sp. NPDC026623]|uniref:hypothetical protein n=1 Tax=Actinoplanes sp. NPDC026623 TaxID=3155610 RepID=UPI0033EE515B